MKCVLQTKKFQGFEWETGFCFVFLQFPNNMDDLGIETAGFMIPEKVTITAAEIFTFILRKNCMETQLVTVWCNQNLPLLLMLQ